MSELKFFLGTTGTLSVSLVDENDVPITDASKVSATIVPSEAQTPVIWNGTLTHTVNGIYEATIPGDTFMSYEGVLCVAKILAEKPLGTEIAYQECFFTPQVRVCEGLDGGSGTIGTMLQRILEEVDADRTIGQEAVLRAIISAIEDYRWKPFFFNKFWFTWQMTTGVYEYGKSTSGEGWPANMLWIQYMQINDPVNGNLWWEVFPVSQVNIREWQSIRFSRSVPRYYKFMQEKIIVGPVPNRDYMIECDGVEDIGTPTTDWKDGRWNFYDPVDPSRSLDMSYTNSWFTWGERLIRAAASKKIYMELLKQMDGAAICEKTEREEFQKLTENTEKRQVPRTTRLAWGL